MNNIEFFTVKELNETETEWVKITTGENAYIWMSKADYDEQQANQANGTISQEYS